MYKHGFTISLNIEIQALPSVISFCLVHLSHMNLCILFFSRNHLLEDNTIPLFGVCTHCCSPSHIFHPPFNTHRVSRQVQFQRALLKGKYLGT